MVYTLYADVILAVNFILDVLVLAAVRRMLKLKPRRGGSILAGTAGAFYALAVSVFSIPAFWEAFFTYAAVSVFMILLAFRIRGLGELLRAVAGLYLASCLLAGVMELLACAGLLSNPWLYAGALPASLGLILVLWRQGLKGAAGNGHLFRVTVEYRGNRECFTGFLDTGNRLTEPITGKPVCILSAESAGKLFERPEGLLYIPFRSVGKESGLLPAVKAERMEIENEDTRLVIESPYIALSREPLSRDNAYQMLLNEGLWL